MANSKMFELHVLDTNPDRFYVINLRSGEKYPLNQFPKCFENMDLEYLNSIVEVIPEISEGALSVTDGTYCIVKGSWPYYGLFIGFNASEEFEKKRQDFNDRISEAGWM